MNLGLCCRIKSKPVKIQTVKIEKPEITKPVEDSHEALMGAIPGMKLGLAFGEALGNRTRRRSARGMLSSGFWAIVDFGKTVPVKVTFISLQFPVSMKL